MPNVEELPASPRWLTIKEFCARYRVGHTLTFALLRDGKIARVKVGRATRIPLESAEKWAVRLEKGAGE